MCSKVVWAAAVASVILRRLKTSSAFSSFSRAVEAAGADEEQDRDDPDGDDRQHLTEVDGDGKDRRHREGHHGGEEPPADHGQHPADTIDGALPAPRLVRKGGSHGHHEGHVGGRQGEFERRRERNQGARDHQVDRGPHEVEGRHRAVGGRCGPIAAIGRAVRLPSA